ncbi:MAG: lipid A biosynthesis lauroyltransferase [Silanimonas sp.]|nr:MAG: lipid A biosynthesis lauroyltransferase [Silanimonas sp.]
MPDPDPPPAPLPPLPPGAWHPRHWPGWLGVAFGWCAARLPARLQHRLGAALGGLLGALAPRRRRAIATNLALCFPALDAAGRAALLRENLRQSGIGLFEFLRAWWGRVGEASPRYTVEGLQHLEALRSQGRGVLLVSAHFVHLELCARLLTRHVPVAGMYRPHGSMAMEWAVKAGRLRYACAMFTREELRPALKHLKAGGILWFAPDQESRRGESVFVPFFGRPAWSLTSTHQLARLSGAAVCPFFHERLPDGSYRLEVQAPLADFPTADANADTARVMAALEAMIRRAPAQYLWLHQRFKTQPALERGALYR